MKRTGSGDGGKLKCHKAAEGVLIALVREPQKVLKTNKAASCLNKQNKTNQKVTVLIRSKLTHSFLFN